MGQKGFVDVAAAAVVHHINWNPTNRNNYDNNYRAMNSLNKSGEKKIKHECYNCVYKHVTDETCKRKEKRGTGEVSRLPPVYSEQSYLVLQCFDMRTERLSCQGTLLIDIVHAIMRIQPQ